MTPQINTALRLWRELRFKLRLESLALIASLSFALTCNGLFWTTLLADRDLSMAATWGVMLAFFVAITTVHFVLLAIVCNRWIVKPVLALLIVINAFAVYYISRYTIYLDPSMLRNVLRTDVREASDLMSLSMLPHLLLYALLPLLLLSRVQVLAEPMKRAVWMRTLFLIGAVVLGAGAVLVEFQDISATMRNNKALRYLVTPANYLYSILRVTTADASIAARPLEVVGADATRLTIGPPGRKPVLLVLVVGETARAANWGLNGYAQQTTPKLAQLDVVNFPRVTSCGTNTEVSLPCMFSAIGRRDYDETRIRSSESLLHVLRRAGVPSIWLDNQSGCKGVCSGLEFWTATPSDFPALCPGGQCFDEVMVQGAERLIASAAGKTGDLVLVMHQMGNHGPAYFKRYPAEFEHFKPACQRAELGECSQQEIVNAYDNALLYTDHFLASTISLLQRQTSHDAVMIYVSDHGESLGENNLYLHGMPYSIAPRTQTEVPMVMWVSSGYAGNVGLKLDCLRQQAAKPTSHDNLFHTVLGMLDIRTAAYEPALDFIAPCR